MATHDQSVESVIRRGGTVASEVGEYRKKRPRKSVIVYFDPNVLVAVDNARAAARISTSRQRWIIEAILEKLDRA